MTWSKAASKALETEMALQKGSDSGLITLLNERRGVIRATQHIPQVVNSAVPRARSKRSIGGHKVQAGRNDPCPCGSGKKFKKCCKGLS